MEKGAYEPRRGKDEVINHACLGKNPLGQREEQSQRLEAGACLTCLRNREASVTEQSDKRESRRYRERGRNNSTDALGSWKGSGFFP